MEISHLAERIAILETLLKNHLKSHDRWLWYLLVPIAVATIGKRFHEIIMWLMK
jgi:hypothetical protein